MDRFRALLPKRLHIELKKLNEEPNMNAKLLTDTTLMVSVKAQKTGVFRNQEHQLYFDLVFFGTYPQKAPQVKFMTKIWHPNVGTTCADGYAICLDILKEAWSPQYSLVTVVNSILLLMESPNPSSPLNSSAAVLWRQCEKQGSYEPYAQRAFKYYLGASN